MVRITKNGFEQTDNPVYDDPNSEQFRKGSKPYNVNSYTKELSKPKSMTQDEWIKYMVNKGYDEKYLRSFLDAKRKEYEAEREMEKNEPPVKTKKDRMRENISTTKKFNAQKQSFELLTGRSKPLPASKALLPVLRGIAKYIKWSMQFDDKILANQKISNWIKRQIPGEVDDKIINFVMNTATWSNKKIEQLMEKIIQYTNRKEKEYAK